MTDTAPRLDKWLWAARFFRTRSLAVEAVKAGRVECNGSRAKPSRSLRVGDRLLIRRGDEQFDVEVLQLSETRGPATVARTLYAETTESLEKRESRAAQRRAERLSAPRAPLKRPDKQARRRIRSLLGR